MSRNQKITKLSNAIREYRGARRGIGGPWIRLPAPEAKPRIIRWLGELGRSEEQIPQDIEAIDKFASLDQFRTWISKI